jgi:hypothetical protein
MFGLLAVVLVAAWLYCSIWASLRISKLIRSTRWRSIAVPVLIIMLAVLPLVDEALGAREFEQLCERNDRITVADLKGTSGTVYLADLRPSEVPSRWIHILATRWRYLDVQTDQTLVSYDTLEAGGGWLSRVVPSAGGHGPILFKGFCEPREASSPFLERLRLTQVQRSQLGKH